MAAHLNALDDAAAREALARCCGAERWVEAMLRRRPFASDAAVFAAAEAAWAERTDADVLEALDHHPRIGTDLARLRERFATTAGWASAEQGGVAGADEATLEALQQGNLDYEARFGFIFVVCATGKSAGEMLALLRQRMHNDRDVELGIAAGEQGKITALRLQKLA